MMKNCELAEFILLERAMEMIPGTCRIGFSTPFLENSPLIVFGLIVLEAFAAPPWIMNPSMIRWKVRPS